MEAFVEKTDEPRKKDRVTRKAPLLGNSWAKEGNVPGTKKKDLRYWGVGTVEGTGETMAKKKKKKASGLEKALMGVEDPFEGF